MTSLPEPCPLSRRVIKSGDVLQITCIPQTILVAQRGGQPCRAVFNGEYFRDLHTNVTYEKLTQWLKTTLLNFNVHPTPSGWDCIRLVDGNNLTRLATRIAR